MKRCLKLVLEPADNSKIWLAIGKKAELELVKRTQTLKETVAYYLVSEEDFEESLKYLAQYGVVTVISEEEKSALLEERYIQNRIFIATAQI